jgi:hypothetical protein
VKTWDISDQGSGRVVVVDPHFRTEAAMRDLGNQLRVELADVPFAAVEVYDDQRAAALRDRADLLHGRQRRFHDQHRIAVYGQGNGVREMKISLRGLDSDNWVIVKY